MPAKALIILHGKKFHLRNKVSYFKLMLFFFLYLGTLVWCEIIISNCFPNILNNLFFIYNLIAIIILSKKVGKLFLSPFTFFLLFLYFSHPYFPLLSSFSFLYPSSFFYFISFVSLLLLLQFLKIQGFIFSMYKALGAILRILCILSSLFLNTFSLSKSIW